MTNFYKFNGFSFNVIKKQYLVGKYLNVNTFLAQICMLKVLIFS